VRHPEKERPLNDLKKRTRRIEIGRAVRITDRSSLPSMSMEDYDGKDLSN
jgi:hypothetical protein